MNIGHDKILLQRLAADYGLGTMRGGARRRFEALARQQSAVRSAIHEWQGRLAGLTELQPAVAPPDLVWQRIELALRLEREAAQLERTRRQLNTAPPRDAAALPWWRQLFVWQGVSAAALSLALITWWQPWSTATDSALQAQSQAPRASQALALLLDADQRPAWLALVEEPQAGAPSNTPLQLRLQDLSGQAVPAGRSLQLWAVPAQGTPRSLGVLVPGPAGVVLTARGEQVRGAVVLALSLEVEGGVPESGGPQGPVLFKGAISNQVL